MRIVEVALYNLLAGNSSLTNALGGTAIYNQLAPQGATYPMVVFSKMAGQDDNASPHRSRQIMYLVEVRSQVGLGQAGTIDAIVDGILHQTHLSLSGWTNYWTARESDVLDAGIGADGRAAYRSGGVYRFRIGQ